MNPSKVFVSVVAVILTFQKKQFFQKIYEMLLRLNKIQNELFSDSVEDSLYSGTLPLVLYLEFLYDLQNISPIEHVWATTFVNSKEIVSSTL